MEPIEPTRPISDLYEHILIAVAKLKHCPEKLNTFDLNVLIIAIYKLSYVTVECTETINMLADHLSLQTSIDKDGITDLKKFNEDLLNLINRG